MTVSIEALAMAGVDYNEWGLDIEKWEADDDSEWPPPHLLAEEEEEEEPERVAKRGFQVTGSSSLTHSSEDFDGDSDDINANKGATLECRHGRVSQGRALAERIIHCLRSTKPIVTYIIRLLMIAIIVRRKRFLKSSRCHAMKTNLIPITLELDVQASL